MNVKDIISLRDKLFVLDFSDEKSREVFNQARFDFIGNMEGKRLWAYDDATGKQVIPGNPVIGYVTVGIGFNMDAPEALQEWTSVFEGKVDFEQVKKGLLPLTEEQMYLLFGKSMEKRACEIEDIYEGMWPVLRGNERLAIQDLYFNCPGLVSQTTKFFQGLQLYCEKKETAGLLAAVDEVKFRSNPKKIKGLQNRRDAEALMLNSTQVPSWHSTDES